MTKNYSRLLKYFDDEEDLMVCASIRYGDVIYCELNGLTDDVNFLFRMLDSWKKEANNIGWTKAAALINSYIAGRPAWK